VNTAISLSSSSSASFFSPIGTICSIWPFVNVTTVPSVIVRSAADAAGDPPATPTTTVLSPSDGRSSRTYSIDGDASLAVVPVGPMVTRGRM
jgi:hypothetical protein